MKKIISILACVCLLLSAMVIPVSAAGTSATITFDDTGKRTSSSTEQQVWEENGITVTNNKGSGNNIADYANPARFYKGSEVIIEYPGMTTIVVNANTAAYATALVGSCTEGTVTASGKAVTIVLDAAANSYTVTLSGGQVRVDSITVYTGDEIPEEKPDEPIGNPTPDETNTLTIAEAIELGNSKAHNAYTTEKYYLTGKITDVANTQYGNLYIADDEGNELYIYGIYNEDGTVRYDSLGVQPNEGDTITVYSIVGNYNGPQLKNAWLIECTEGELEPVTPDPEADSTLTIEEAIALGESKKSNIYTQNKYYVSGTITEVYNEEYGNMYIADENGNTLTIYGTYSEDGEVRYDAMETKPVAGDTITVYGIIGNYNGAPQMKNGWITSIFTDEEQVPGIDPEDPIQLAVNTSTPAALTEVVVPAGATVFMEAADANGTLYVTSADGSYMLINGRQNQLTADGEAELVLCGYEVVNVYNPSETDTITLYVFLTGGAVVDNSGTIDNPEEVTIAQNMFGGYGAMAEYDLAAGSEGRYYKTVAPADGIITVGVSAMDDEYNDIGWMYVVNNATSGKYGDNHWSDEEEPVYYEEISVSKDDEIIVFVNTYDPNNMWNAPAGKIVVDFSFAPIGSQNSPIILENTGAQTTTVDQASQGLYYKWVVTEDGIVTITMNDETGWQYFVSKVPVDEEDYGSYYTSETHWYSDDPVVATETIEVAAGETIKIWVNTFNAANEFNPPAGTVNWTLDFVKKAAAGKFSIADADAVAGKEFTVAIDISNNPGIIGAKLNINYDVDVLELVSATAGDFANGSVNVGDEVIPNYNFSQNVTDYPYVINWTDPLATENTTTNGTFAILTFKVKDAAVAGTTEISITFEEDDIIDKDLNNVAFEAVNSIVTITVEDTIPGDVNGDGKINGRDYTMMLQSINGWDVTIDKQAADVTGDGNVNGRDYTLLLQYINGWDVTLK